MHSKVLELLCLLWPLKNVIGVVGKEFQPVKLLLPVKKASTLVGMGAG